MDVPVTALDPDNADEDASADTGIGSGFGVAVDTITGTTIDGFGLMTSPCLGQPITAGTASMAVMTLVLFILLYRAKATREKARLKYSLVYYDSRSCIVNLFTAGVLCSTYIRSTSLRG